MPLVLERKFGEGITVGPQAEIVIWVMPTDIPGTALLSIEAPRSVPVDRAEVLLRKQASQAGEPWYDALKREVIRLRDAGMAIYEAPRPRSWGRT